METFFECPRCGARHERLAADGIVPNPQGDMATCDACADLPAASPATFRAMKRFRAKLAAPALALLLAACGRPDPAARLVTSSAVDQPLSVAVSGLVAQGDCHATSASGIGQESLSLDVKNAPLGEILDVLGRDYHFTWSVEQADPCVIRIERRVP